MDEVATTSPQPVARANPFAPQHCPDCGYALTGLPPAGRCPECGKPYDDTMLVIYGYGAAGRNTAVNRRTSNNAWLHWVGLLAPPLFLAWMWLSMRRMPMFTFYVIVLIATSVITWWRRRTISSPKPVQLRLVGAGFAQRDGFGSVRLHPWTKWGLRIRVRRRDTNRWVLQIARPWLVPQIRPLAGIEFEAEPEAALHLSRQLEDWIRAAGSAGRVSFNPQYPWWMFMPPIHK